jgi:hypothetical protein
MEIMYRLSGFRGEDFTSLLKERGHWAVGMGADHKNKFQVFHNP